VKTTLAPKFGGPAQRWGRAGLRKGGARWNLGPPIPPLIPPPLPPSFLLPSLWSWGGEARGREEEGGGRGGGVSGGKGGGAWRRGVYGLGPCTTPSLGCPPKDMLKLDHFSISFGVFFFFLWIFFVHQTKMELFRFTVGIFIL
jgi:hypothetical protein